LAMGRPVNRWLCNIRHAWCRRALSRIDWSDVSNQKRRIRPGLTGGIIDICSLEAGFERRDNVTVVALCHVQMPTELQQRRASLCMGPCSFQSVVKVSCIAELGYLRTDVRKWRHAW